MQTVCEKTKKKSTGSPTTVKGEDLNKQVRVKAEICATTMTNYKKNTSALTFPSSRSVRREMTGNSECFSCEEKVLHAF